MSVLLILSTLTLAVLPPSESHANQCAKLLKAAASMESGVARTLTDPLIERARELRAFDDYKWLSDLVPKTISKERKKKLLLEAVKVEQTQGEVELVRFLVLNLYREKSELTPWKSPLIEQRVSMEDSRYFHQVNYIEQKWKTLIRRTPKETQSSLIPLPHPIAIPGDRFQEGYYWDTYFAFDALILTGRERIVYGQIENFLYLIERYGFIPNGNRQYYLSRSQPPLLSQMITMYVIDRMSKGRWSSSNMKWLRERAYPLLKKDYLDFWMNPKTRYDKRTKLNHHYDNLNTKRPERHSTDNEEGLARTYRDVRAEAESGKDFTAAFQGQATAYAGVLLNSVLYQVEKDLAWMARILNLDADVRAFEKAAKQRQEAMIKLLWSSKDATLRDYNYRTKKLSRTLTADGFAALAFNVLDEDKSVQLAQSLLRSLEKKGGIVASDVVSGKQWDAPYGWAPHQYFAIKGLFNVGLPKEAKRIARKFISTVNRGFEVDGHIYEKYDVVTGRPPKEDGDKYPTQEGFLFTNGVYLWSLVDVLGIGTKQIEASQ